MCEVCVCEVCVCEMCVCEVCVCEVCVCEVCVCEVCVCEVCVCEVCVCEVCVCEVCVCEVCVCEVCVCEVCVCEVCVCEVCVCGDGCAINLKASRLVGEKYGLEAPFSRCNSHSSSGTIRRITSSVTMSDPNAVLLYNNLRTVLKHFSMSPKSTELLNKTLAPLEQNDIHMLVWGVTRMAGFLDACKQASSILVPFVDCRKYQKR